MWGWVGRIEVIDRLFGDEWVVRNASPPTCPLRLAEAGPLGQTTPIDPICRPYARPARIVWLIACVWGLARGGRSCMPPPAVVVAGSPESRGGAAKKKARGRPPRPTKAQRACLNHTHARPHTHTPSYSTTPPHAGVSPFFWTRAVAVGLDRRRLWIPTKRERRRTLSSHTRRASGVIKI